ncbi:hypothetical protein QBC43DRAFT_19148 [Cladorrhinum sp. PSN259]|nr:hypothetical protein QBC43DRAFT_19148 [Cladorrhinum sp. PSN259]
MGGLASQAQISLSLVALLLLGGGIFLGYSSPAYTIAQFLITSDFIYQQPISRHSFQVTRYYDGLVPFFSTHPGSALVGQHLSGFSKCYDRYLLFAIGSAWCGP